MIEHIDAFHRAMNDAGLVPADPIPADGQLHRFYVEGDRPGSLNGWDVLHLDGVPAGAFGSWKSGTSGTWCAKSRDALTPAEREENRRRIEQARQQARAERERTHKAAAARAAQLWANTRPATETHPYLVRKRVPAFGARQRGDRLVLAVVDFDGRIWSLQFIAGDGGKKLLTGGAKRGHFIHVNGTLPAARVLICEGWATGATLAEAEPAALVLAAIDAGNLQPVAVEARRRWPAAEIVICCDRDPIGTTKGRAAALAAGALVAIPQFPPGAEGSDFNDLVNLAGGAA